MARTEDTQGSGKATLNLEFCVKFFEVSKRTLFRWINSGVSLGFFRGIRYLSANIVQVYYVGAIKLAKALGVQDFGAIVRAPIEALKDLKKSASIATLLLNQKRSVYQAGRKKGLGQVVDIPKLFKPTSALGIGAIARTARYIYLSDKVQLVGGSQKKAAWELSRHESTIQRRLKGISPANKRQLAQTKPEYLKDWFYAHHCEIPASRLFKIPDYPTKVFRAECCVYNFNGWELLSKRYLRSKLNRALQSSQNSP